MLFLNKNTDGETDEHSLFSQYFLLYSLRYSLAYCETIR